MLQDKGGRTTGTSFFVFLGVLVGWTLPRYPLSLFLYNIICCYFYYFVGMGKRRETPHRTVRGEL